MLGKSLILELFDDLVGRRRPTWCGIGLTKFYHAYQVALDMAIGNEFHKVCTGKPPINEQIVETDAVLEALLEIIASGIIIY